jgi:dTDP-4-amino-4,6-dideoxygalactose transaminase
MKPVTPTEKHMEHDENQQVSSEKKIFFPSGEMIPVTRTFLPPFDEYATQLKRIFHTGQLTNRGPLVRELEEKLMSHLDVPHLIAMCNGTVPLQIALRMLALGGEVITTPFSYVATTASIVWEHCMPVFADIEPEYLTIDPDQIEAKITPNTTAILATHVFGNPCDVERIDSISNKYNIPVIYDAAHGFGVTYKGKGLLSYGAISTCSFHATKIFQTGEGGAMVCNHPELRQEAYYRHNFGHDGPLAFQGLGINGKMSELNAAMGLSILPYMEDVIQHRRYWYEQYLNNIDLSVCIPVNIRPDTDWNYAYAPFLFPSAEKLEEVIKKMTKAKILPRRYFHPSLHRLPYIQSCDMPISEDISRRIICLPLYHDLTEVDFRRIITTLSEYI